MFIVAIDSDFDDITRPVFKYRKDHVYSTLTGPDVVQLSGANATRGRVTEINERIDLLTGSGHGQAGVFFGNQTTVVYGLRIDGLDEPKGRIVHFLACDTALELGPDFINNGCDAFFGYAEDFTFHPDNDPEFFECDSQVDLLLMEGLTAKTVELRVRALYLQRIAEFRAQGKRGKARMMEVNLENFRRLGKPRAKLKIPS